MANQTKIEWTQMTWNPITGCSKVSAGCKNCYAERLSKRLKAMGVLRYQNGFKVTLHEDILEAPMKWKKSRLIFANSMSDLFHEDVPLDFVLSVFGVMAHCPQHIFQILTKRSSQLVTLATKINWPDNVWMGVTVEDKDAVYRVHDLVTVPASVRFLSCEPLIGEINNLPLDGIHWVIVGGESGPKARPMKPEWVELIYSQCREKNVPFFFKQWGGVRKKQAGRLLHGQKFDDMPRIYQNYP
jgi:protein gp37